MPPVRCKGNCRDKAVRLPGIFAIPVRCIPENYIAVMRCCGQRLTIRRKRQDVDCAGGDYPRWFAVLQVPEYDTFEFLTDRLRQLFAVRRKRHRPSPRPSVAA